MDLETRIDRLEEALTRLAQAQARTEERVGRLEERVGRLEDAVIRLAEAQARTEARLGALAEAQARTEARLGVLAEAQTRTEARVDTLAQAQVRTESALLALTQQVGRLSDTIGFTLEDLAREVTPPYLAQHYGIHIGQLDRRFFSVDEKEVEVDLYGEGHRDGETVVVVGEVRSRIYGRDVEGAVQRAERLRGGLPGTPVVVLFGFVIHPSAREAAHRLGAIVISSSGRFER
jgi:predicted nuclease with TOPRIM domain